MRTDTNFAFAEQAALPGLPGVQRGVSVEIPALAAATLESDGRQWVKLLPYGVYTRQYTEPWVLSAEVCGEMAGHFAQGLPRPTLPWNCNHKRGTEAPGWIEGAEARTDGLWVLTRWTEYGRELLDKELLKFCSAEWHWTWQRPSDGAMFRNVLAGAALTNDPFFLELPALAEVAQGGGATSAATLTPEQASAEVDRLAKQRLGPQAAQGNNDAYAGAVRDVLAERPDLASAAGYAKAPAPAPAKPRPGMSREQASTEIHTRAQSLLRAQGVQSSNDAYGEAVRQVLADCPELAAAYTTGTPATGQGMIHAEASETLHALAQQRLHRESGRYHRSSNSDYAEAIGAVLAERPDLAAAYNGR